MTTSYYVIVNKDTLIQKKEQKKLKLKFGRFKKKVGSVFDISVLWFKTEPAASLL